MYKHVCQQEMQYWQKKGTKWNNRVVTAFMRSTVLHAHQKRENETLQLDLMTTCHQDSCPNCSTELPPSASTQSCQHQCTSLAEGGQTKVWRFKTTIFLSGASMHISSVSNATRSPSPCGVALGRKRSGLAGNRRGTAAAPSHVMHEMLVVGSTFQGIVNHSAQAPIPNELSLSLASTPRISRRERMLMEPTSKILERRTTAPQWSFDRVQHAPDQVCALSSRYATR